jgi:hypothetical protein
MWYFVHFPQRIDIKIIYHTHNLHLLIPVHRNLSTFYINELNRDTAPTNNATPNNTFLASPTSLIDLCQYTGPIN